MIEMRYLGTQMCPVLICDRCQGMISQQRANVEYTEDLSRWRVVHKAQDCDRLYAERLEDREEWPLWDELETFFANLLHNAGFRDHGLDHGFR